MYNQIKVDVNATMTNMKNMKNGRCQAVYHLSMSFDTKPNIPYIHVVGTIDSSDDQIRHTDNICLLLVTVEGLSFTHRR